MKFVCSLLFAGSVIILPPWYAASAEEQKPPSTQTKQKPHSKSVRKPGATKSPLRMLSDFDLAKWIAARSKPLWSLTFEHNHPDHPLKTYNKLSADLNNTKFLDRNKNLRPYHKELARLPITLRTFGDSLTYFFYSEKEFSLPFEVVQYKGTKCFVVHIITDNVYNTRRLLSSKKRAAKVAASHGIPALRELAKTFRSTDIGTLAVFVTYGTQDFLDESIEATKPEILGIVASKSDAIAFTNNELTDIELAKKALILISDRDETHDFTKIEIQIE